MSQSVIKNLLSKAIKNHQNKNFYAAEKLYEKILEKDSKNINCINYLGTLFAETGRENKAKEYFLKVVNLEPNNPFVNNNLANIFFKNGEYNQAILHYNKAISLKTDFADPNYNLGILYKNQGKFQQALNYLKKVTQIQPSNLNCYGLQAQIFKELRNFKEALNCYKKIFELDSENYMGISGTVDLFNTLRLNNITENNSKDLVKIFEFLYEKNSINHNYLFNNVKQLIIFDEDKKKFEELIETSTNMISNQLVQLVLKKKLFHLILQKSLIRDQFLEKFLYAIRKEILFTIKNNKQNLLEDYSDFILSFAEQSFLNEYIFFQSDDEINFVEALKLKIEKSDTINEQDVAILACYIPLSNSEILINKFKNHISKNELFNDLIKIQIHDFLKEKDLKKHIKSTEISDSISNKVRDQYEENPYPRWRYANYLPKVNFFEELNHDIQPNKINPENEKIKWNILIAGCGTGHQLARRIDYKNSNILAIDLSLSSLAFAKRRMQELNINNIEFLHTDLLKLLSLKRKFNVIECMGVLHHLENPEKGLNILLDILEPGGFIKLGLYSEYARKHIVETRELLKDRKFKNNLKDIRNFREIIKNDKKNIPLQKLNFNYDFHTTSSLRDLVFHVQEHRFTLPKISKLIQKYNLEFLGFANSSLKKDYSNYYKDDKNFTSLMNWNEFEIKHPDIFKGMYQFWLRKK